MSEKEHWLGWVTAISNDGWVDLDLIGCNDGIRAVMQLHKSDVGVDMYGVHLGTYVHIEGSADPSGFVDAFRVVVGLHRILCKGNPDYFRPGYGSPTPLTRGDFAHWLAPEPKEGMNNS